MEESTAAHSLFRILFLKYILKTIFNFILTFIQNIKQDRSMSDIVIWIGKTMTLISDSHILQYDIHLKKRFDTKSKSSSSKQKTTP